MTTLLDVRNFDLDRVTLDDDRQYHFPSVTLEIGYRTGASAESIILDLETAKALASALNWWLREQGVYV